MGSGFALFLWLMILGAFGALWMAALGVYCHGRDIGAKTLKWVGGVPFAALTLVGLGCVSFVVFAWIRSTNPDYVFESQFHQSPTTDVTNLKSSYWCFADCEQVFLSFNTTPKTFRDILPKNVRSLRFDEYRKRMPNISDEPPSWWHAPTKATAEIYFADSTKGMSGTFYEETTLITFEPTTGTVMYFFIGID